jgi:hypothetical protein
MRSKLTLLTLLKNIVKQKNEIISPRYLKKNINVIFTVFYFFKNKICFNRVAPVFYDFKIKSCIHQKIVFHIQFVVLFKHFV